MQQHECWLLPAGIEELLPPQAAQLERVRRRLLDLYDRWGYELVTPPLVEFLQPLLTGSGRDLELKTFKLTDQMSGRLLGVRADMTPQVARIDAHRLRREVPTRLCYVGTVLHTLPEHHGGTRAPFQVGLELYGHPGPESDLEVLTLMVQTLREAGLSELHIDLGHVGLFRSLAAEAALDSETESALFDALQRKAHPEIEQLLAALPAQPAVVALRQLADLHGGSELLDEAAPLIAVCGTAVQQAFAELCWLVHASCRFEEVQWHIDLAELRGYHYHTGLVFAAFIAGRGQAVAQGGRYDAIGEVFGRARPATGFSIDLTTLLALLPPPPYPCRGIFAPAVGDDSALATRVTTLREQGERVVQGLPQQQGGAAEAGCDRQLVWCEGSWQVQPLG